MLNLFVMLSLENLPENLEEGMNVHGWSWVYFVSYALTASFLLLNILIGVVINSMEEARTIEHRKERAERMAARLAGGEDPEDAAMKDAQEQAALISERLLALRDALEDLEDELHTVEGGQPARRTRTRSTS